MALLTATKDQSDDLQVLRYIDDYGFGPEPPELTRSLNSAEFRQHYYNKQALMDFCRSVGMSTFGSKNDLNDRIELFLHTGRVTAIEPPNKITRTPDSAKGLSLTKIVVNYKSDPLTRAFFRKHIPEFTGFSALVQKQIKERLANGDVFTYGDVITWHRDFIATKAASKKLGVVTQVAHESCQFNQFSADYSRDSNKKLHSCRDAWKLVRDSAGAKTYERYIQEIDKIRTQLSKGPVTKGRLE